MEAHQSDKSSHRFTDTAQMLHDFSRHILVHCPKCERRAYVQTDAGTKKSELKCPECHYSEKEGNWYGLMDLVVRQRCDACGKWIEERVRESKVKYTNLLITCAHCKQEKAYKPLREKVFTASHIPTDPVFGLRLWLQADFGDYVLWAYNKEHLQYLKEYIAARLREKNGISRRTLALKLPQFIKSAKNRDALLKLIAKLEQK
ncbi:hypothetical protein GXP67_33480 [Rhodocytophaga rosea]|uniref:TFIIB-type zinc ribbon-containing protein n=1 Tax=Rhodocytophaga rosea TaxID=2704465 RepID=A0A6C0GT66_9BACT|nr:hypothetical protein [Rhodocytophaga rosea]QHT71216.1 hypothetical protein GXP67_33480 [Rhodocytophaga rosea]